MPTALLPLLLAVGLAAAQQPARSIAFKNSCPRDVWVVGTSGATGNCADGCQEGSTCNDTNGLCFFDVPAPSNGYRVKAGGDTVFTFPAWNNANGAAWSGNFQTCMEGTLCWKNGLVADDATCDAQGCASFHTGTMAEITMQKKNVDFYDVSVINGLSVPMSFAPTNGRKVDGDPYFCGNLGAVAPATGLGVNSWKFDVPDVKYKWVVAAGDAPSCASDADCGGSTCGLDLDRTDQVTFKLKCGVLAGYWTQNAICAANQGTDVFDCSGAFQNGPMTASVFKLQGCTGDGVTGSCYTVQPAPDTACCGCADWQDVFGADVVPEATHRCQNKNPLWTEKIQPTLEWLKRGVPNVYTYPYDDVSSTSTCDDMQGEYNTQNYVVELCPSGVYWGVEPSTPPPATDPTPPPTDPAPVDPAPVDPAPVDPAPVDPQPTEPAPVDPAPTEPAPVDPAPTTPAPSDPAPADPPKVCNNPSKRAARKAKKAKREAEQAAKRSEILAHHHARHAHI